MYTKCCVVNCDSRRKDVSFHRFPKTEIGLEKWLHCINSEKLQGLSLQELRKQFVCRKHFEKRFLASTRERARLRPGAYPSLFTASEITNGIPHTAALPLENNVINSDHDYTMKRKHVDHTYSKPQVLTKRSKLSTGMKELAPLITENINVPSTSGYRSATREKPITSEMVHSTPTRRRRVIYKKNMLTPHCAKLYKEYIHSRRKLNFNQRAKKALRFSKEKHFQVLTENIKPLAKKFLWMQIKQSSKKARGRRFTNEEKLIALSIMKQSPKCYRFLQKIFILPSKYTVNKMLSDLNMEAGINHQIFEAVKKEVTTWNEKKKYCSILFDEVSLEAGLTYDKHKDLISGFVELNEKTDDFADHALVFMLRGVVANWQQPMAFYFCKGATSGVDLKKNLKEIITAVIKTGLMPLALVSDQGTAFQSALKSLQQDTRREQILAGDRTDDVIEIAGHKLSVIHDPPHLIKGIRNNFLSKNIKYQNKISKWSDIVDVYKADCNHAQMRLLYKLNDEHVIPEKIKKMKVKNCTRVLSKTVAATLSYTAQFSHHADGNEVSPTMANTAEIVSFFDDLFDSVNGTQLYTSKSKGKPLRQAVTEKSPHHEFWPSAIKKLEKIKFIDNEGRETSVPSLKNWITTLKSYQKVWQFLKEKNIKIMRPRYLNSDPIENFFGQLRAYNFRNNDPNCHTFKSTFRSLLVTRFIKFHSESYNCEEDSGEQVLKLETLFSKKDEDVHHTGICSSESSRLPSWVDKENIEISARQERLEVHSRAYTTGWVIRKILKNNKCEICIDNLTTKESNFDKNAVNNWTSFREFKSIKQKKLTYPSEQAVRCFGLIIKEANDYLETQPHHNNLIEKIKNTIKSNYVPSFLDCQHHKNTVFECFLQLTLKLGVNNWCNVINRILKGTDVVRLQHKTLPAMQAKAFAKYKTKLKNKKLHK